jgi:GT2 family glycosyltransferase
MMQTLQELYRTHTGKVSDKWSLYIHEYDRLFQPYRSQPVRLLEIGIQNGGSLEIWSKYFAQAEALIGCDINPDCAQLQYEDQRIQVIVGDANAVASRQAVQAITPKLDLLIDDGSHVSGDIIESFLHYFPMLEDGGLYVAEDLHCSYWQEFDGGLFDPASSIAFFKALADIVNHEHWGVGQGMQYVLSGMAKKYGLDFSSAGLEKIHSVEFVNSVCVIRKQPAVSNQLGRRQIVGQQELVVGGHAAVEGALSAALRQEGREWSINSDMALAQVRKQLEATKAALQASENVVNELVASRSWRLTYPLRWSLLQARKMRALWRKFQILLRSSGGFAVLMRKALRVYSQEGFSGVSTQLKRLYVPILGSELNRNDYAEWVRRYDTLSDAMRRAIRERVAVMAAPPLISVVMPTYNPSLAWLEEAIASVRNQLYPHWQLCIADDASTNPAVRPLLERLASEDDRIKVIFRPVNGHISAASNSALELATGAWVALLDHDDVLPEHALYCVASAILERPDARLIYSDEDKINEQGMRFSPYFKTDWNPELFLSHNMICHLGVYRRDVLTEIGGFRVGFEGAQDYDLALRFIERIEPAQIHHIPRVLYHWRMHQGSTAAAAEAKPYAMLAGERALNEHLQRRGIAGRVELVAAGYRTHYQLPETLPLVSLIIPTRNGLELVRQCVESITQKTDYPNYEIILVDNGSDDPAALDYFAVLARDNIVRVLRDDRPFNYSRLNNDAVAQAKGDVIALINNDVEVISPDWLSEMVGLVMRPEVGAVGAKLLYPNGTIQHAGVAVGLGGVAGHLHKHIDRNADGYCKRAKLASAFSAVTAACLLVRRSVYQEVGGLNETDLTVAFNDVDFCLRVREAGYRNVWTPYAELYHHESATRGYEDNPVKQARFAAEVQYMMTRWGQQLLEDPYYNKNLTLDHEDLSLAWPPRVLGCL